MKGFMNKLLGIFKNKKSEGYHFKDIHRVCMAASEELGEYCNLEGYNMKPKYNHYNR